MSVLSKIFSFKEEDCFKVLTICGIRIKKRFKINEISLVHTPLNRELCLQNLYYTHSQTFPQFKNINAGKDVAIIGTGPTLAKYEPIDGCINIGLNRAYQFDKIKLDYIFMYDFRSIETYIDRIRQLTNVKKFYGRIFINENGRKNIRIPEYCLIDDNSYEFYLDKYCSAEIKPNLSVYPLFDAASIALPALHFALYTHPKKIYLVGCDTNSAPYWDGSNRKEFYLNISDRVDQIMTDGYKRLKVFCKQYYPDIEIISVNPVGLRGMFKDVYTKQYLGNESELKEQLGLDITTI